MKPMIKNMILTHRYCLEEGPAETALSVATQLSSFT